MPNLNGYPVGASLLADLGGIYALEEHINMHTVLASESGIGGGIAGIPDTAHLPGVCFRFDGSGRAVSPTENRANYCKILRATSDSVHIEFRDLRKPSGTQVVRTEKFVSRESLKEVFCYFTGLYIPGCEAATED